MLVTKVLLTFKRKSSVFFFKFYRISFPFSNDLYVHTYSKYYTYKQQQLLVTLNYELNCYVFLFLFFLKFVTLLLVFFFIYLLTWWLQVMYLHFLCECTNLTLFTFTRHANVTFFLSRRLHCKFLLLESFLDLFLM